MATSTYTPETERLINVQTVASMLGTGKSTIWRWVSNGMLPEPVRLGMRTTRWKLSEINQFISDQTSQKTN